MFARYWNKTQNQQLTAVTFSGSNLAPSTGGVLAMLPVNVPS
jgi:hypothetical protein